MTSEEIQKVALTVVISIVASTFTFMFGYGSLNAKVEANTEKVKDMVPRTEHENIYKWQEKYENVFNQRMTRLENKVDRLVELELQKGNAK